jgi:hypothetical protein
VLQVVLNALEKLYVLLVEKDILLKMEYLNLGALMENI